MSEAQLPAIRPAVAAGGAVAGLIPQTIDEAWRLSEAFALAGILPRGITTAPQVMLVICGGAEVGFGPFQSLQSFYLVNNRLTMWGDAIPALLWTHGFKIKEWFENTDPAYPDQMVAKCLVTRPTGEEIEGEFSVADAKEAKLWSKDGPWQTAKKRMLKMRARAFAARDGAPDVLRGVAIREEVEDYVAFHDGEPTAPPPLLSASDAAANVAGKRAARKAAAKPEPGPAEEAPAAEEPTPDAPGPETQTAAQAASELLDGDDLPDSVKGTEPEVVEEEPEPEAQAEGEVEEEDAEVLPPEFGIFADAMEAAELFVDVKAALQAFFATGTFKSLSLAEQNHVRFNTWQEIADKKEAGQMADLPDHATDVSTFRLWIEWCTDPEAITGTLAVLEQQPAFASKEDTFKDGIRGAAAARVQRLKGG